MELHNHNDHELYPSPKRIRVVLGGLVIADSWSVIVLLHEHGLPVYYFPFEDIRQGVLSESGHLEDVHSRGTQRFYNVRCNGSERCNAAWEYVNLAPGLAGLEHHVAFDWPAMDAWFEEDEEVYVHARDPRKRIDTALSSSHVRVLADDVVVADSLRPVFLFETGMETRYYLPKLDVRLQFLIPSTHVTYCPYKGEAHYFSLRLGSDLIENVVWYYRYPTPGVAAIAGLLCFFQDRVAVEVDGDRV